MRLYLFITIILFIFIYIAYICYGFAFRRLSFGIKAAEINFTVPSYLFDTNGYDTLVFLHIQKTGGTLIERSLTKDGLTNNFCKCTKKVKRCNCKNKLGLNWLFSRYSTGWKCGLHADWTELDECVGNFLQIEATKAGYRSVKRNKLLFSIIRNPNDRFVSEWRHVQRGATWWRSKYKCNGKGYEDVLPRCYDDDWMDVTLPNFMSCPFNFAINRMTRMMSNLRKVDCYNDKFPGRHKIMLESAKQNLENMLYFGIVDYISISQYLFQRQTGLSIKYVLFPLNQTHTSITNLSYSDRQQISRLNSLDWELYNFAKLLLMKRFLWFLQRDQKILNLCCRYLYDKINWNKIYEYDVNYCYQNVKLLSEISQKLVLLDGSKYAGVELLKERQLHWKNKLKMDSEYT